MTVFDLLKELENKLFKITPIGPLVVFRIAFGFAMLVSTVRFLYLGWLEEQYLKPVFHFTYYGFDWVKVLSPLGMYALFGVMIIGAMGIMLGAFYRISSLIFFLSFTYIELIDKTYYLNHYYFVSLISFLMCFLPAHRRYSIDVLRKPLLKLDLVPAFTINILKFQIGCVYFFAGIAKINSSWLLDAMPLKLWLPAQDNLPLIGPLFREEWLAYTFAWVGMIYDLCIPFLLLWRRTRLPAYIVLLIFHSLTGYFFQIGVFPLVMSLCTLIFFPDLYFSIKYQVLSSKYRAKYQALSFKYRAKYQVSSIKYQDAVPIFQSSPTTHNSQLTTETPATRNSQLATEKHSSQLATALIAIYIIIQLALPFRYLLYSKDLFWSEEGYRFSWRVMLVEKAGTANFRIRNNETMAEFDILNRQFLNQHQEKQMAFQPDMILQYAHYLGPYYKLQGLKNVSIYCDCYVTMNGKPSKPIVDPSVDLLKINVGISGSDWILNQ